MTQPTTDELAHLAPGSDASLTELQEWMVLLLRHGRGLAKSPLMREGAARHFSGNARLNPAEQVDIYRQQFWLRHTSTLVEDFPGLTGLLDQKSWEPLVETYLSNRDNDAFALKELGRNMALHLTTLDEKWVEAKGLNRVLLVEMAKLEWAYIRAFDLGDDPTLSSEKLAQIPPEAWPEARFVLSPTLSLFRFEYPVANLRRNLRNKTEAHDFNAIETDPHYLVVYRRERTLFDKRVSQAAYLLLQQFGEGTPLVPACENVVRLEPEAEAVLDAELTEWFTLWGRLGWIVDVEV